MNYINKTLIIFLMAILSSCSYQSSKGVKELSSKKSELTVLADEFFEDYTKTFPNFATFRSVTNAYDDRLNDNSLSAHESWLKRVEAYNKRLNSIKAQNKIDNFALYSSLELQLQSELGEKICKLRLWRVNIYYNKFNIINILLQSQPFGSEKAQKNAIRRFEGLPKYFDNEIESLNAGLELGLSSPKEQIELVIGTIKNYLKEVKANPNHQIYVPTQNLSPEFKSKWADIVDTKILPSYAKYMNFLEKEYLNKARNTSSISKLPGEVGEKCYSVLARSSTSSNISSAQIDALASKHHRDISNQAIQHAKENYNVTTVNALYKALKVEDAKNAYKSEAEVFRAAKEILSRAKKASKDWFSTFPKAEIIINKTPDEEPGATVAHYRPASMTKSGKGEISFQVGDPKELQRSDLARLTIHEGIPGHHMQAGIADELNNGVHNINKYFYNSAFGEGWAVYAEMLAYEKGFYKEDELSGYFTERTARNTLVNSDIGIHRKGWTREEAIKYLMDNGYKETQATQSIDAIIAVPSFMLSYSIAPLEFIRIREEYKAKKGDSFNLKEFHDLVLENGNITLIALEQIMKNDN